MADYEVAIYKNGDKFWWQGSKRHREDGPAVELANGDKFWYVNDKLHRTDGPAVELANGDKFWYIDGFQYTEEEFNEKMNSCDWETVIIGGREYIAIGGWVTI